MALSRFQIAGSAILLLLVPAFTGAEVDGQGLERVDAPDIERLIDENQGRVVLLNFWASWCRPCLTEFPEIVELEKTHRDRGLTVISVSADFPSTIESGLLPFLEKNPPGFPVYLKETDDIDAFIRAIDDEWRGGIPATFFVDRDGVTAEKRIEPMTREEMEEIVEVLLEEPQ